MTNTAAHFRILCNEIKNIETFDKTDIENHIKRMKFDQKIKYSIKKHNIIIENVKNINSIFSFASLMEMVYGSIVICGYCLQFLVNNKNIL